MSDSTVAPPIEDPRNHTSFSLTTPSKFGNLGIFQNPNLSDFSFIFVLIAEISSNACRDWTETEDPYGKTEGRCCLDSGFLLVSWFLWDWVWEGQIFGVFVVEICGVFSIFSSVVFMRMMIFVVVFGCLWRWRCSIEKIKRKKKEGWIGYMRWMMKSWGFDIWGFLDFFIVFGLKMMNWWRW